jgi:hypothetical protein
MSASTSASQPLDTPPLDAFGTDGSEAVDQILRLKRKLAATHQELDEARGGRSKKIP